MEQPYFYLSPSLDGWQNLAMDEWLLDHIGQGQLILYLYVNQNAVIIGKNQNPWKECNLAAMEQDKVQLVRRVTGGGAVFHDSGNLNFSFIAGKGRYDLQRQMGLILSALQAMGIPAEFTGRNDLTVQEKKFSGNAFCVRKDNRQHHGTLLVHADLTRLQRYLTVDPRKIQSKGIDSVRSRVCNLSEFVPQFTVPTMAQALREAFSREYGDYQLFSPTPEQRREIQTYYQKQASWEWQKGRAPKFDVCFDPRFSWGGVQLMLWLEESRVSKAQVFTDAMDVSLPEEIVPRLLGARFSSEDLFQALASSQHPQVRELAQYLREQTL